ncbi:hypothetical protein Pyn_25397 [Prunus yedoensis var. nudiflora]|uniref:Uncharacterized protein n=1 Tax=Prunus yedoensis var. nudiflora TaxID=2094558 RepID=A0A314XM53_PRUYE|nr:hypothetical protein Pyn_25397 [Prunus yedoensis var. nudiflora]
MIRGASGKRNVASSRWFLPALASVQVILARVGGSYPFLGWTLRAGGVFGPGAPFCLPSPLR